jgi:DNA mismatch repair ATPase MutS
LQETDRNYALQMERLKNEFADVVPGEQIRVITDKKRGWMFWAPLRAQDALIRTRGVKALESRKNGVRFSTDELDALSKQRKATFEKYKKSEEQALAALVQQARSIVPALRKLSTIVAELDVSCAFAAAAQQLRYVKPVMRESQGVGLKLKGARHPCVEQTDGTTFIPNDIEMNYHDSTVLLVTGNALMRSCHSCGANHFLFARTHRCDVLCALLCCSKDQTWAARVSTFARLARLWCWRRLAASCHVTAPR